MAGSDPRTTTTATIASSGSLSGGVKLGTYRLAGIVMPASWTAASISFQVSADGGVTYSDLYYDDGVEVSVITSTSRAVAFNTSVAQALSGYGALKIRSGLTGSTVNQAASRTLTLVLVPA